MSFFMSKNTNFLKQQISENYNGYYANVFHTKSNIIPSLDELNLLQYPFEKDKDYKICVTSPNKGFYLISNPDFYLWHNTTLEPKILTTIIKDLNWVKLLSNINNPINILLKENDSFYVFRNQLGLLYYDKNLNISSKQFECCKLLSSNKPFLIDFKKSSLIPF